MIRLGLFLISLVTISACADVCERAPHISKNFDAKQKPCSGDSSTLVFSQERCTQVSNTCTERERQLLQQFLDCLEKLPACEPATKEQFRMQVVDCAGPLSAVSPGCSMQ